MRTALRMGRLLLVAALGWTPLAGGQSALAPVEARVPFAPAAFVGSDGQLHLAYELQITNVYADTGPLRPLGLDLYADDGNKPLLRFDAAALARMIKPAPIAPAPATIAAGRRAMLFVWLSLPAGTPVPQTLRQRIVFATANGKTSLLDGAAVTVDRRPPMVLGPPLRGGRWWAHEGPGAADSHHWGSLVAVNGWLTIPQRYALDLVGLDANGQAIRAGVSDLHATTYADWVGYGAQVLAVADGVVRAARDGQPEHRPLQPQAEPPSLTNDGVFGNYVVLEIAPGTFVSYGHLQRGSVLVRVGASVRRGQVLGRLGQSGNSAAPHLHFQVTNAATFEGSEGRPYEFERFDLRGTETEPQVFGQGARWQPAAPTRHQAQLPLNDEVIEFPATP